MSSVDEVQQAIIALEAQRSTLDAALLETSLAALQRQLDRLQDTPPAKSATLMQAILSSSLNSTDTTASGKLLGTLHQLQSRLKAIAASNGGHVSTDAGYDVAAVFESTIPHESAIRAVQAAMQMVAEVQQTGPPDDHATQGTLFSVHTGLHTIPVAGKGTTDFHQRIALSLRDMARPNEILISRHTYQQTRGRFAAHSGHPLTVEYLSEALSTYVVSRARTLIHGLPGPDGVHGMTTRLIGRSLEMRQLQEAWHKVTIEQHAHWLTLVGEAGVGKTRLMLEFLHWLDLTPEPIWLLSGRASPESEHRAFGLWEDLLVNRCEIQKSDSMSIARQKLVECLTEYLGAENAYKAHFIGHLIGLDFSDSPHLAGILSDAQQIHDRALTYVIHYMEAVSDITGFPIVMIAEDIQWADDGSLALLEHLATQASHLPLLVVATARPSLYQVDAQWGSRFPDHRRLDLAPLSDRAMNLLVAEILRNVVDLPRQVVQQIVSHAAGNPFYVWEYVRLMIEDGVIIPGPGEWKVSLAHFDETETLPSLNEIITARLQHLPPPALVILEWAAIIGRVFWDRAVADMAAENEPDLDDTRRMLNLLERQQLVAPQPHSSFVQTIEYKFSHPAVHQIVYEQIPPDRRHDEHARAATWLIGRSMNRIGAFAGIIADHYRLSGETQRAVKWYGMAGAQAQQSFAPQTAIRHYQQALALSKDEAALRTQRVGLLKGLGATLTLQARLVEAIAVYDELLQITDSPVDKAHACNFLSNLHNRVGDRQAALEAALQAEELAQQSGEEGRLELARAWLCQGKTHLRLGDGPRAKHLTGEAQTLCETVGDDSLLANCLNVMGAILTTIESDLDAAIACYNQALDVARRLGNRRYEGVLANNIAEIASLRGDHEQALQLFQEAERIAIETGSRRSEMVAACNISAAHIGLGDHRSAQLKLQRIFPAIEASGFMDQILEALELQGMAHVGLGNYHEALKSGQKALTLARQNKIAYEEATAWRVIGLALADLDGEVVVAGQTYNTRASFQQSLMMFEHLHLAHQCAATRQAWAQYELKHGDHVRGETLWRAAVEWYEKVGATRQVERMNALLF